MYIYIGVYVYVSVRVYVYVCICVCGECKRACVFICVTVMTIMITGNELIHQLTNDGRTYTLRVDLTNYTGQSIFAKYDNFSLGPESDKYMLHVSGYDKRSSAGNCHS